MKNKSLQSIREGFKKKNQLWKIPYRVLTPPPGYGKKNFIFFFLKLDHFLRTFCKSVFSPLKIQKNSKFFKKMIKLLLDKQIFASDARFCHNMRNDGRYTQNFVRDTHNFSLDMVLSP